MIFLRDDYMIIISLSFVSFKSKAVTYFWLWYFPPLFHFLRKLWHYKVSPNIPNTPPRPCLVWLWIMKLWIMLLSLRRLTLEKCIEASQDTASLALVETCVRIFHRWISPWILKGKQFYPNPQFSKRSWEELHWGPDPNKNVCFFLLVKEIYSSKQIPKNKPQI